jgi:hypothetical protein
MPDRGLRDGNFIVGNVVAGLSRQTESACHQRE